MARVIADLSMSLDGYVAAPHATRDQPLGEGGRRLHDWRYEGRTARDAEVLDELVRRIGAVVLGRRSYDLWEGEGGWGDAGPWGLTPCFVLTHRVPGPEDVAAPAVFTFVTDGVDTAVAQARAAAGERDVSLHGASVTRQALARGLVDEIGVHLVPVLLGGGVRLFQELTGGPVELTRTSVITTPAATHLRFRVVR